MNKSFVLVFLVSVAISVMGSDPEETMEALEIIKRWGYPGEEYHVTTSDGYILRIQRIPYGKAGPGNTKRPVIFMQHGLECSSTNWITNLPSESAGFIFADAGYDVWLGNFRGNTYGMNHVSLSNKDHEFWEFSWDEMAKFDLEATVNFALKTSGQSQLYYMGHSQGTMTAFAKLATEPEFAKKIIKFFALAPVATVKTIGGALAYIAPLTKEIQLFTDVVGVNQFFPSNWLMDWLAKYICGNFITNKLLCENIIFLICGANSKQLNDFVWREGIRLDQHDINEVVCGNISACVRVPVYVSHTPAGTSTQNIIHFAQQVQSGKYQMYDYCYGDLEYLTCKYSHNTNTAKYGQPTPPLYNIRKANVPTVLFWGDKDVLADPTDVKSYIIPNLPNLVANCELPDFNHMDFIWGLRAHTEIYLKIVDHIKNGKPLCDKKST